MLTKHAYNQSSIFLALVLGTIIPTTIATTPISVSAAPAKTAAARLADVKKQEIGTVKFSETPNGLQAVVQVQGLAPGEHAIHVHEFGKCDPPNFLSAGEHFDPVKSTKKPKYETKEKGKTPAGDLPNLKVKSDGTGTLTAILPGLTLGNGPNSLLKPGGTAVIVHAGANGKSTMPGIDAKTKIACGVVVP